jgi:hypothetical protein
MDNDLKKAQDIEFLKLTYAKILKKRKIKKRGYGQAWMKTDEREYEGFAKIDMMTGLPEDVALDIRDAYNGGRDGSYY